MVRLPAREDGKRAARRGLAIDEDNRSKIRGGETILRLESHPEFGHVFQRKHLGHKADALDLRSSINAAESSTNGVGIQQWLIVQDGHRASEETLRQHFVVVLAVDRKDVIEIQGQWWVSGVSGTYLLGKVEISPGGVVHRLVEEDV